MCRRFIPRRWNQSFHSFIKENIQCVNTWNVIYVLLQIPSVIRMQSVSVASESGHESMVHSLLGRESLASSRRSLDEGLSISARLANFRVSMAYESALHKKKCGLCQLFYHRDTVNYKVPNHRVFDLQREWALKKGETSKQDGRRYQSASYLYTETTVCTFCSQFFWLLNDEMDARQKDNPKAPPLDAKGPKLDVKTDFERADVSSNQRAYQSSDVDSKFALYAVAPPYNSVSKTRREVDPWWEVDLGRNYQLSKISFKITVHVRQEYSVYLMLLSKPFGFEDPFLDSISGKARECKMFQLHAQEKKRQETLTWHLPERATCFAIRVQLKGIHILELQQFQAFLGDEVIMATEEDAKISSSSFATLNPKTLREGLKEMMSPQAKAEKLQKITSPPKDREKIIRNSENAVKNLTERINSRYVTLGDWKNRVLEFAKHFTMEEIECLYKVIFKYTAEMNKNNPESSFNEHDLLDSALMEHYPRCDLQELHTRIRTVLRWIQTRSHLKVLGALLHSENLNQMSINSNELLYKFMSAIKRIELYWDKKEEYEVMYAHLEKSNSKILPVKVKESRGCSWSQFIVVFSLFLQQRCDEIAYHAFRIENPNVSLPSGIGDDLISAQSYQTGDAMSVKSFDVSLPDNIKKRQQSMVTSQSLNRLSTPANTFAKINSAKDAMDDSILLGVRKDTGKLPFDSRMSEYKMDCLLRRMARVDIEFPKDLDLAFAKALIPTRDGSLGGNQHPGIVNNDVNAGPVVEGKVDDNRSHLSRESSSLSFNGVPLPSRPVLNRGNTAKFQLIRSTSKLSKLLTDENVEVPNSKKHAMFNLGKSSRNLLSSSSAPSSSMLLAMHTQRSTRSINSDDDSRPAPPLSRHVNRVATARDLNGSASFGHNLTTVREGSQDDPSLEAAPHVTLTRSPSRGNVLHTSNSHKQLPRTTSAASVMSSSGDHFRHSSPVRPATSFQLQHTGSGSGAKAIGLSHPQPSPMKSARRGSSSPMRNTTAIPSSTRRDDDSDNIDDVDFDDDSHGRKRSGTQELKSIDFHRICSLCELRLPRASVDFKVMRKHVVKLKSSWDPKLVSKEVRQLDNTISMFNLVFVCAFCAQFFDPDFPDGVAYPKRVAASSVVSSEEEKLLNRIQDNVKDPTLLPFYDTRYTANSIEVGDVFRRPHTKDSRKRASRAVEVAKAHNHHALTDAPRSVSPVTGDRIPSPARDL